jgi:pimeloyl-ACP methyl ester carboxylesterase
MTSAINGSGLLPHQWHGAGEPLVLVAGLGTKGTSWRPFLETAARHFHVLSFDNRGSGRAPSASRSIAIRDFSDDLLRLLDALGLERVHLVGRSMGGMIAQELALRAPERVARLVLVSTAARADAHLRRVFELWAELAERGVPADLRHRATLLWCLGARALAKQGAAAAYLERKSHGDRPRDYALQARACAAHDALDRLGTLSVPTLVVGGSDDRLTPPAQAVVLARAIPAAELAIFPGAGHLPYLEAPAAFAARVLEFLWRDTTQDARETQTCRRVSMPS